MNSSVVGVISSPRSFVAAVNLVINLNGHNRSERVLITDNSINFTRTAHSDADSHDLSGINVGCAAAENLLTDLKN